VSVRSLETSHRALTEELLLINFEERAGVQRIAAWQSFATRAGFESARSFVAMLIQTDRFGTPIAKSLGCLLLHRLLGNPICRPEETTQ
jgi:tight adherence protein C